MYQYQQHQYPGAGTAPGAAPAPAGYPSSSYPQNGHQQLQPGAAGSPYPPQNAYGQRPAPSPQPYYGAPAPGPSGYAAPAPPNYQQPQHQQPQQPAYYNQPPPVVQQQLPPPPLPYNLGSDPSVFKNYYSNELRQLTFNSKIIINNLTSLAGDHAQRMAPIVAQCIEDHIRQTPPSIKLPPLYLLDSICKNIGPPYTTLFARTIDRIILTAYREVDGATKLKLDELIGTWRNGGRDGGELFKLPPDAPFGTSPPQRVIEEALYGRQPAPMQAPIPAPTPQAPYQNPLSPPVQAPPMPLPPNLLPQQQQAYGAPQAHTPQPPSIPVPPTPTQAGPATNLEKAAVLYELRKLLSLRREHANANPADRNNHDQIATLMQLEQLVQNSNLGSPQLMQIRDQLARLAPPQAARLATPPVHLRQEGLLDNDGRSAKRQRLVSPPPPARALSPNSAAITATPMAALGNLLHPDILRSASSQAMRMSATPQPSVAPIPLPPFMAQHAPQVAPPLVAPIPSMPALDANLLSSLATAPVIPTAAEAVQAQEKAANERALGAYDQHRLHYHVRLLNSDVARYRPGSHALLYEAMPLRCKQCGNRYLDCPSGNARLAKDLDRHLRISRRYNDGVGAQRAVGRSWFALEEEWVLPAHAIQPSEAVIKTEEAKKAAAATAEILNKFVPVPASAATDEEIRHCPICKEEFKNEYNEEEEDWIWRNAVDVDGRIYHASCKAEQGE